MQIIKTNKHTYFLNEVEPSGRSMEVLLLRDWLILVRPPLIPMRVTCSKRVRLLPPHSFWVLEFGLAVYFYSHSPVITMSQSRDRRARRVQILHSPREQSGWETDSDRDTEAGASVWPAILIQCPPLREGVPAAGNSFLLLSSHTAQPSNPASACRSCSGKSSDGALSAG